MNEEEEAESGVMSGLSTTARSSLIMSSPEAAAQLLPDNDDGNETASKQTSLLRAPPM